MTETPNKGAATTRAAPGGGIDAAGPEAGHTPLARPWRGLGPDPREATATQRARRQGLTLMLGSALLMIVLLVVAGLLLHNFF